MYKGSRYNNLLPFFALHKTYGTLCKNQEEQDGAICKKKRTWLSILAATCSPALIDGCDWC